MPDTKTERAEDLRTNDTTEGAQTDADAAPTTEPQSEEEKQERRNPLGYTVTEPTQQEMQAGSDADKRPG